MTPYLQDADFTLHVGDALDVLRTLPDESVDCCVTSPPYFNLRDYGVPGQIGLEPTLGDYVAALVAVFREVRRVLTPTASAWVNLGDTYAADRTYQVRDNMHTDVGNGLSAAIPDGLKQKDMMGVPWRVAFALQADGWWLRSDIVWSKPNQMPESVTDRPTKSHEYVFLLTKQPRYYYDAEAIREAYVGDGRTAYPEGWGGADGERSAIAHSRQPRGPDGRRKTSVQARDGSAQHRDGERWPNPAGRNARSVWEIATQPYPDAHFATFPEELARRCILAGCPPIVCERCGPVDGLECCNLWHGRKRPGVVLDPFLGSGTTALVARKHGRHSIGIELSPEYAELAARRLQQLSLLAEGAA